MRTYPKPAARRNSIPGATVPRTSAVLVLVGLLSGCGTTSPLVRSESPTAQTALDDLSGYHHVVVLDFSDQVSITQTTEAREAKAGAMEVDRRHFADVIAKELSGAAPTLDVSRQPHGRPNTLVISGDITRLNRGNAALRLLIGFGAGSSYFDATVRISDPATDTLIGTIQVDKNSWPLGGGLAAAQSVESLIDGAAKKIAGELVASGLGQAASVPAAAPNLGAGR